MGFKNRTKVWAVVNALKNNGIKMILEDDDDQNSHPRYPKVMLLKFPSSSCSPIGVGKLYSDVNDKRKWK